MNDFARLALPQRPPPPTPRGAELVNEVLMEYKFVAKTKGADKSVNLVCSVGGREFDVYSVGYRGELLTLTGKTADGTEFKTFAPVEQVSFTIILSKKTSPAPPREIGFAAEMQQKPQQ